MMRPTFAGLLVLLFGALACYGGLLLDDRALMGVFVAVALTVAVSLIVAVAQFVIVPLRHTGDASVRSPRWFFRLVELLAPRDMTVRGQYEQCDADGVVIGRFVGAPPRRRGLYRLSSTSLAWRDLFGLIAMRRVVRSETRIAVLPDVETEDDARRLTADLRMQGRNSDENAGSVRGYMPGDPPKTISWRHSAHRGALMTRETDRESHTNTAIVVDTDCAPDALDAAAAQVAAIARAARDTNMRLTVIAGTHIADDYESILTLLAAIQADGEREPKAASKPSPGSANAPSPQEGVSAKACETTVERWFAARRHESAHVTLYSADPRGPLATALHTVVPAGCLHVRSIAPLPDDSALTAVAFGSQPVRSEPRGSSPAADIIGRIATAATLLVFFGVTVHALTGLASADDVYWPWFAAGALGCVAIESQIPSKTALRAAWRTAGMALAVLVATVPLVILRVHDIAGVWLHELVGGQSESVSIVTSDGDVPLTETYTAGFWQTLADSVGAGFDQLNLQLPPLNVDAAGDLFLILIIALAAVILRCLLFERSCAPALIILPAAALAADYAFVGRLAPWWELSLLIAAFPLSLWAAHPRRIAPAVPVAATAAVTAIALALTPAATAWAYRVPLSIGDNAGLFSANTINPMIDLKRTLQTGSESTVLSYQAEQRLYLRMATLDDFDGDTWNFDQSLAIDGGFYGSGIRLGANEEDELDWWQRISLSPLSAYLDILGYSDYLGYDAYGMSEAERNTMSRLQAGAQVNITTLSSRFLPVIGDASSVTGVNSNWVQYEDGTVYNRTGGTDENTNYRVYGSYITPISTDAGFSQIDGVLALGQLVRGETGENGETDMDMTQRLAARTQAVAEGYAERVGGVILAHFTLDRESGALVDAQGEVVATVANGAGIVQGADDGSGTGGVAVSGFPFDYTFTDALKERLGIADDDIKGLAFSGDDQVTLALLAVDVSDLQVAQDEQGEEAIVDGATGEILCRQESLNGTWRLSTIERQEGQEGLAQTLLWAVVEQGGYAEYGSAFGSDTQSGRIMAERYQQLFDALDERESEIHERYAGLPDDLSEQVNVVVEQARADGVATDGEGYDQQVAAMRWLVDYFTDPANGFTYTLDAPDGDGRNNMETLDDFLDPDGGHAGYCAHYASALAVLGRAMGVPTRMVLGYNAGVGERDSTGRYNVMARQLHAWVEAYIDSVGWVPFDVTPATSENGSAASETGATDGADSADADDSADTGASVDIGTDDGAADDTAVDDDVSDDDASDADASDESAADDAVSDTADDVGAGGSFWSTLPSWARVALIVAGVMVCAIALASLPAGARALRRRRRFAIVEDACRSIDAGVDVGDGAGAGAGAAGGETGALDVTVGASAQGDERWARAWRAAWSELRDSAWDAGVRWESSDSDAVIAGRIIAYLTAETPALNAAAIVRQVADQAMLAAFGTDGPAHDAGLAADLAVAVRALASRNGNILRRVFPASLIPSS
ncbi:transglutaminaseTgpA domain-containing protein [Bifidobacterium eulemuris]|nr:transglutaminaseTgpA domain-containing protein [Bifidobacterium eulemuris]QOL31979.1 DUF58 domain-containing protein [Bifidobacterium eulemuris]